MWLGSIALNAACHAQNVPSVPHALQHPSLLLASRTDDHLGDARFDVDFLDHEMPKIALCKPLPKVPAFDYTKPLELPLEPIQAQEHLTAFYEAFASFLRGYRKRHLRIGFVGDSNTTMDFITGALRRMLQLHYGDAGHGYVAFGRPWQDYRHVDIRHGYDASKWYSTGASKMPTKDRSYGFAGIVSESRAAHAKAWIATASDLAPVGKSVNRIELYYLKRKGLGAFDIFIDGKKTDTINEDTNSTETQTAIKSYDIPDGPHELEIRSQGGKTISVLGATFDRVTRHSSVQVDSLGLDSLSFALTTTYNQESLTTSLRHRQYDLMIFWLGTNMCIRKAHDRWMQQTLEKFRHGLSAPTEASMLVMAPPDRSKTRKKLTVSHDTTRCADSMKAPSLSANAAFWHTQKAMGGAGSIFKFRRKNLVWGDHLHITEQGGAFLAGRLLDALLDGFTLYVRKHPMAGCPKPSQSEQDP